MQTFMPLLLALLVAPAGAAILRGQQPVAPVAGVPATVEAIQAKYDDMDTMLETVFTMACKAKHGKDIAGLAAHNLKNGKVKGADGYMQEVKDLQASEVQSLKQSCGQIAADDEKACREGCATQWNKKTDFARDDCDNKCVKVYKNFERSCEAKADNLEQVYIQKDNKKEAMDQCYNAHCAKMPMVWMKADAGAMQTEVDAQCKTQCSEDNMKNKCDGEWASSKLADATSAQTVACQAKSEVKKCFDGKKTDVSAAYDTCQKDKTGQCDKDLTTCKAKGKSGEKFCADRQKMCKKQADEGCLETNNAGLEEAQKTCDSEAATALKTCVDDEVGKEKTKHATECVTGGAKTCKDDCPGECQVVKMNTCLAGTKSEDTAKLFCKDFWQLLHATSEVDPVTGNPVALLSQKARITFAKDNAQPDIPSLPEQGYEGKKVKHENMKTITTDWGSEYGPTTQAPRSSACMATLAVTMLAMLMSMF